MDVDQRTDGGPIIEPFRIRDAKVDASVTHRRAEVVMPVCAVQAISLVEIHGERDVRQVISRPAHISIAQFDVDVILTGHRWILPRAGGYEE